jgi:hypothetical protein
MLNIILFHMTCLFVLLVVMEAYPALEDDADEVQRFDQ